MAHLYNSQLAARVGIQQAQTLAHADEIADVIDIKILRTWRAIRRLLHAPRRMPTDRQRLRELIADLFRHPLNGLDKGFKQIAKRAHAAAAAEVIGKAPKAVLSLALQANADGLPIQAPIAEARGLTSRQQAQVNAQLFGTMPQEQVEDIVYRPTNGTAWNARIAEISHRFAPPDQLACLVVQGFAQGQTVDEMARLIAPAVQNVRTSARRIARTEGMRIAHEARMDAFEGLGDLITGYQIHATMDWRTRPEHAARNGTVYYRTPRTGQPSLADMPRPPLEADGSVAHNCRCYLTPVLDIDPDIEDDPAAKAIFTDNDEKLVPDPVTYADWFATASDRERRWAVGARRLRAVQAQLTPGEELTWEHFVDFKTGHLLHTPQLVRETQTKRQRRLAQVADVLAARRQLAVQVARHGYIPAETLAAPGVPGAPAPIPGTGRMTGPATSATPATTGGTVYRDEPPAAAQERPAPVNPPPGPRRPIAFPSRLVGPNGWKVSRYLSTDIGDGHSFELIGPTGQRIFAGTIETAKRLGLPPSAVVMIRNMANRIRAFYQQGRAE